MIITGGLAELLKKGGIYRDVRGATPREALGAFVMNLPHVPSVTAETLLKAVFEREDLMPTGIGEGIALPHPRNPIISTDFEQFAALAFLASPVEWNSLDGKPVDTLVLIVSASAKRHLEALSEITFFSRQEEFRALLGKRASNDELLRYIIEAEKNWRTKP